MPAGVLVAPRSSSASSSSQVVPASDPLEGPAPRSVDEIPDLFGRSSDLFPTAKRSRRSSGAAAARSTYDLERFDQPAGCTLRRYVPDSGSGYWHGKLPPGQSSPGGRMSRRLTWGFYTQRSEAETISLIEDWLHSNAKPCS